RRHAIQRARHSDALALVFVRAACTQLLDHSLWLFETLSNCGVDVLIWDLDPGVVGNRLEHELTRDRALRLLVEPADELLGRCLRDLQIRVEARPATLHHLVPLPNERAGARVVQRPVRVAGRRLVESGVAAESAWPRDRALTLVV